MTLPRISPNQAAEVERLRKAGRTDRQVEQMLGMKYGALRNGYVLDTSDAQNQAKHDQILREHREKEDRITKAIRAELRGNTIVRGWRPIGDCVKSNPAERLQHRTKQKDKK